MTISLPSLPRAEEVHGLRATELWSQSTCKASNLSLGFSGWKERPTELRCLAARELTCVACCQIVPVD